MEPRKPRIPSASLGTRPAEGSIGAAGATLLAAISAHRADVIGMGPASAGFLAGGVLLWFLLGPRFAIGPRLLLASATTGSSFLIVHHLDRLAVGRPVPGILRQACVAAFELLGFRATDTRAGAYVWFPEELVHVEPSWFDLGLPALLAGFIVMLCLRLALTRSLPSLARCCYVLAALSIVGVLRHVLAIVMTQMGGGYFTPSQPLAAAVDSFGVIPSLMLLMAWPVLSVLGRGRRTVLALVPAGSRTMRAALPAVCIAGVFVATIAHVSPEVGQQKQGRILVDDSHVGDWEVGGAQFTTDWRGDMSVYACSAFFESLRDCYLVTPHRQGTIDDALLADQDILVLKVPSRAYTPSERTAIDVFVRRGGGLLAVGDHTDLFGCNSHLNEVVRPYGLTFEPTGVQTWAPGQSEIDSGWGLACVERPATGLSWLTGCSLGLSGRARPATVTARGAADGAVYANMSFFGDNSYEPGERCEPVATSAWSRVGRGRVLAMGDGTILTNFAAFMPGRMEYLRSCVAFLNYEGVPWHVPMRWAASVLAALSALAWLLATPTPGGRAVVWLLVAAAVFGGTRVADARIAQMTPEPPAVTRPPRVAFLGSRADYHLAPTIGGTPLPYSMSFDTLFVEVLRFGFVPRFERSLERALACEALIIPNPWVPSQAERDEIAKYVRRGGLLLALADGRPHSLQGLAEVAEAMGYRFSDVVQPETLEGLPDFKWTCPWKVVLERTSPRGDHYVVVSEVERGMLALAWGACSFSREGMGHPFPVPTGRAVPAYETIDAVLGAFADRIGLSAASRFERTRVSR